MIFIYRPKADSPNNHTGHETAIGQKANSTDLEQISWQIVQILHPSNGTFCDWSKNPRKKLFHIF